MLKRHRARAGIAEEDFSPSEPGSTREGVSL